MRTRLALQHEFTMSCVQRHVLSSNSNTRMEAGMDATIYIHAHTNTHKVRMVGYNMASCHEKPADVRGLVFNATITNHQ